MAETENPHYQHDQKIRGALLINLGTPDEPTTPAVRSYLREFLMDPLVIDLPLPFRWALVHGAILPLRPARSAEAYRKVWTERGSPLLFHHLDLSEKAQRILGPSWRVVPAMRYGKPSIPSAVQELARAGVGEVTIFPLYPQYSLAATESSIRCATEAVRALAPGTRTRVIGPFYSESSFIDAFAERARTSLTEFGQDFVLFSFHGLPERQVKRSDAACRRVCFTSETCCEEPRPLDRNCYRAQCFVTAALIAGRLGLARGRFAVSFQSRLGRTPWIKPFTDEMLKAYPGQGIRRLAVLCPAFVADCLETLEEIEIRGRASFIEHGGEELRLVPSLNSSDRWAQAVAGLIRDSLPAEPRLSASCVPVE